MTRMTWFHMDICAFDANIMRCCNLQPMTVSYSHLRVDHEFVLRGLYMDYQMSGLRLCGYLSRWGIGGMMRLQETQFTDEVRFTTSVGVCI